MFLDAILAEAEARLECRVTRYPLSASPPLMGGAATLADRVISYKCLAFEAGRDRNILRQRLACFFLFKY